MHEKESALMQLRGKDGCCKQPVHRGCKPSAQSDAWAALLRAHLQASAIHTATFSEDSPLLLGLFVPNLP